ncbi:hypothetical protein BGW36DRAFT_391270, partial [Talaromyces proteolyticus]
MAIPSLLVYLPALVLIIIHDIALHCISQSDSIPTSFALHILSVILSLLFSGFLFFSFIARLALICTCIHVCTTAI